MSHVYCPECGFQNPESANYCSRCGALLVNEEMVRRGWALVYLYDRKNLQYAERLQAAEDSARTARRGWWASGEIACRPSEFRHRACS